MCIRDRSTGVTPEAWAKFMSMQSPVLQGMMGNTYMEQSKAMVAQMTEQIQKQTEQMLGSFGLKR